MYLEQGFVSKGLIDRLTFEGIKTLPVIRNSEFATNVETKPLFRTKLLKSVGIDILIDASKPGIDIGTELWFDGKQVISINHSIIDRHLMEGNKGPMVRSMGSVLWLSERDKLFDVTIGKLIPFLKKVEYVGPFGITARVTENKIHVIEINATFGYNTIFVLLEMYKGKVSTLISQLADRKLEKMEFKSKLGIGVDLSILPFPMGNDGRFAGISIEGLNKFNLKHFWGYDIYSEKGKHTSAGLGGRIGTFTARGDDIEGFSPLRDARRRVYRTINNVKIPDVMYRLDIGNTVETNKQQLVQWGWLNKGE